MVLNNLIDNAVNYTNQGGQIWLEGHRNGDFVHFSIRNTGSDVAAIDTTSIFERFWRGDAARSQTGRHCGLGLALCRRLIMLLGGTITAQSTFQGEFVIAVMLPMAPLGYIPRGS